MLLPYMNSNIIFHTLAQCDTISTEYQLVPLHFEARTGHEVHDLSFQRGGKIHVFLFVLIPAYFSAESRDTDITAENISLSIYEL